MSKNSTRDLKVFNLAPSKTKRITPKKLLSTPGGKKMLPTMRKMANLLRKTLTINY